MNDTRRDIMNTQTGGERTLRHTKTEWGRKPGGTGGGIASHLPPRVVEGEVSSIKNGPKLGERDRGGREERVRRPDTLEVVPVLDAFAVVVNEEARSLVQPGVDDLAGPKGARRLGTVKRCMCHSVLEGPRQYEKDRELVGKDTRRVTAPAPYAFTYAILHTAQQ